MNLKMTLLSVLGFLLIGISLNAQQYSITTDHPDANYSVGESVNFLVHSNVSATVTYEITRGKFLDPIKTGQLNLAPNQTQTISYTSNEPGALHIAVKNNWSFAGGAAIVGANEIGFYGSEPGDFDSFWNGVKNELNGVPMNPVVSPLSSTSYSNTYTVQLGNIDGRKVYGRLHVPKGAGPFPAVVEMPAYGSGPISGRYELAERTNCIVLAISIHNAPVTSSDPNAYSPDDPSNRDLNYHKHSITAGIRAIDYLVTRNDFNGSEIAIVGESQGGGLGLLLAGIDNRVDVLAIASTSMSNHAGLIEGHPSGFPGYLNIPMVTGDNATINNLLQAMPYYDAVLAAKRFHGPTLLLTSYDDKLTDSETQFAGFNQLDGPKVMIHNLSGGHDDRPRFTANIFGILRRYFPAAQTPPFPWASSYKGYGVQAGPDKTGNANQPVSLVASIEKDLQSNPSISTHWRKVSGPGNVSFSNQNSYSTTANFSQQGTYVLEFVGKDLEHLNNEGLFFTTADRVVVTIGNGTNPNQIDLALSLSADATEVPNNTPVTFNLTLTNSGPSDAHNIQSRFQLPSGLVYSGHSAAEGTYQAGSGFWSLSKLSVGASRTLTVTAVLEADIPTTVFAQVTAATEPDVDSAPNNNNGSIPNEDDETAVTIIPQGNGSGGGCNTISGFNKMGELNGHGYYLSNQVLNWNEANAFVQAKGGYLATITTSNENEFIRTRLNNKLAYIGFNDSANEGVGEWANGEPVSIALSYNNSDLRDYASMNFWNGTWEMLEPTVTKYFVMEKACSDIGSGILTINCPQNINIMTGGNSALVNWDLPMVQTTCTASSNVSIEQLTNFTPGTNFSVGTYNIIYQATDQCGNTEQCSFVVTVQNNSSGGDCGQITGFTKIGSHEGHSYYLSDGEYNWVHAKNLAESHEGYLTTISTSAENTFIKSNIGNYQVFIGLHDSNSEGNLQWSNGEPISLNNVYNNTNSRDYALINFWNGNWEMQNEHVAKRFVMEKNCGASTGTVPSCDVVSGFSKLGELNNHGFYISLDKANWHNADVHTKALGGYLAAVSSLEENTLIRSSIGNTQAFIGLTDENGYFQWANGEPVSLNLSYHNTSSRNFAMINFWDGSWELQNSQVEKHYILEKTCAAANYKMMPVPTLQAEKGDLFPNPTNEEVTIRLNLVEEANVTFKILNMQGQEKLTTQKYLNIGFNEVLFDLIDLPQGSYMIMARGDKTNLIWKFIKN